MFNEPQMQDLPAEKQAAKAIRHTLVQISDKATLGYFCGYGTQTYALLTESLSTLTGKSMAQIAHEYPPAQPRELDTDVLRECPFCGGHYLTPVEGVCEYKIECADCAFRGPYGDTPEEARENWNKRSIQSL